MLVKQFDRAFVKDNEVIQDELMGDSNQMLQIFPEQEWRTIFKISCWLLEFNCALLVLLNSAFIRMQFL